MTIYNVFTMLGGLAMFLYGMSKMGEALEKQAGSKLKSILERLTSSTWRGLLLGLGVTAVIQSSSATTVMVVGFVNSGIMQLHQAVGVIMGANIGTTVTAWILSLTGLSGSSLLINLLNPSTFSPILAVTGIILYMGGKTSRQKDTGTILLGFAILMFGMETMSAAVKPLADMPEFTRLFTMFSNPLLGLAAGAILTGIIQSSSASVGILQALSATGQITFGSAIPIILGQNIGTCVTAMISSVGANTNARRAALVHLYFNIIGATVFLIAFYSLKSVLAWDFVAQPATQAGIALVHSIFNILATAVLLPFNRQLERLACLTIRDQKEQTSLLDERFLGVPAVALSQAHEVTIQMAHTAKEMLFSALEQLRSYTPERDAAIHEKEEQVDAYEDHLGTYLVKLSAKSLSDADSRRISTLLHIIGDLERLGDHAVNLTESARELANKKLSFSEEARSELETICNALHEVVDLALKAFAENDLHAAQQVEPLEEVIDQLRLTLRDRHIVRLQKGSCSLETGFVFSDILTNLERAADHCSNIAVCLIEVGRNSFETHAYLHDIKAQAGGDYEASFRKYQQKYALSNPL